ncbi:MAG: ATP-binding protein [Paludibacteraceae bacterium]|nr:ATP-binding protein [Paludibacteraceae bacterium]
MVDIKEKYKDLQPLPCGVQDFEIIRTNGLLYADKTEYVYKLASDKNSFCYFLGRPRRFGKSLFLSTLECYFNARKDLFDGLKVMELEQKWTKYEVLRFDLSGCSTTEKLTSTVLKTIIKYEQKYNIENFEKYEIKDRFSNLIETAAKGELQRVVILIDEYDSALQQTMYDDVEHEKMRTEYRDFFSVFKSDSHYIFKIFLTGIMKFTQLSLFSVLNNIKIISASDEYAGVCGFTHEELQTYFRRHVERLADASEMTYEQAYQSIIDRYDSYSFSKNLTKVINPYSLLNALADCKLGNYWVTSGATKVLMDTIDSGEHQMPNWDCEYLDMNTLEGNDADRSNLILSLYQTGYLTIKEYNKDLEAYRLGVPNHEVKEAISKLIIPRILNKDDNKVESTIFQFKKEFILGDVEKAMQFLQALVAGTPYSQDNTSKAIEERFQFILVQVLFLCGFKPQAEVSISTGRVDIVCKTKWRNAIFELKMTSNGGLDAASEQIKDRCYAAPFLTEDKELLTFAIEFDSAEKSLTRWKIEKIK